MQFNDLSGVIIGCAIEFHKQLWAALLESAYEECLHYELLQKGLIVERQKPIPVVYKESLTPVHTAQVLTYLKFAKFHTGLLINVNVISLPHGIKRLVM